MSQPTAPGTIRAAWQHRQFRRLVLALAGSQAGDWLYNVALLTFVYDATHSAGWLSVTTAVRVIPVVVLGPLGGVVADRFDRRLVMITSDLLRVATMIGLTIVAALHLPVLLAPLLAGLGTSMGAAYPSCAAASTSRLVPAEDLPGANALRSMINPICVVGGPVLGAVLLAWLPATALFGLNALTFALSALFVWLIPAGPAFRAAAGAVEPASVLADVRAGLAELRRHPAAARLVGADLACSLLYGAETVLLLMLSRELGAGSHGYGWLLAAVGAGGVASTAMVSRLGRFRNAGRVVGTVLLVGAVPFAFAASVGSLAWAMLIVALGGAAGTLIEIFTETALQRELDEDVFGRAYGFAFPASIAGIVIGSLLAAPLASLFGLVGALAVFAGAISCYAGWLLLVGEARQPGGQSQSAEDAEAAELALA